MTDKSMLFAFLLSAMALTVPQASIARIAPAAKLMTHPGGPPDSTADFDAKQLRLIVGGAKGKGATSFQSMKEVVITTKSRGEGVALNLGIGSVTITLDK